MVAFAMTEEDSAEILKDAMERHPPPSMYFPHLFGCFCALHGVRAPEQVEQYADKCGLTVMVKVIKLPPKEADAA